MANGNNGRKETAGSQSKNAFRLLRTTSLEQIIKAEKDTFAVYQKNLLVFGQAHIDSR